MLFIASIKELLRKIKNNPDIDIFITQKLNINTRKCISDLQIDLKKYKLNQDEASNPHSLVCRLCECKIVLHKYLVYSDYNIGSY